jgi:hypothetical protein
MFIGGFDMNIFRELFDSENGKVMTFIDYLKSSYID